MGGPIDTDVKQVVAAATSANDDNMTQDSSFRYAAYANRFRTILLASHRYVAYTSDIGESFRPVAHPYLVKVGYAVSWAYILGDCSYQAWKVKMKSEGRYTPGLKPWDQEPKHNAIAAATFKELNPHKVDNDWKLVFVKNGIFQALASMALPAFTIHSAVRYSSILFKNSASKQLKTFGPVGVGLAIVPALPYLFDKPVEHIVDVVFEKGEEILLSK